MIKPLMFLYRNAIDARTCSRKREESPMRDLLAIASFIFGDGDENRRPRLIAFEHHFPLSIVVSRGAHRLSIHLDTSNRPIIGRHPSHDQPSIGVADRSRDDRYRRSIIDRIEW